MTESAAKAFATAAASVRKQHDAFRDTYYKRFIGGKEKPTKDDVKKFAHFVKESEAIADAWHTLIPRAIQGFGGSGDNVLGQDRIMLKTLLKNSA